MCLASCRSLGLQAAMSDWVESDFELNGATDCLDSIATDLTGGCPAIDAGLDLIAAKSMGTLPRRLGGHSSLS